VLVALLGLIPILGTAALSLYRPFLLTNLELGVYDTVLRMVPLRPPSDRIVIVDVDERSLAEVGQWPWRRDLVATLIDRIRNLGASVVALDMIFAEPDRHLSPGLPPDQQLARTLRGGRVVLGYALTFDASRSEPVGCVAHPLSLPIVRQGDEPGDDPLFRATGAICNLPLITSAADASGFLNAAPDSDGILRRAPVLAEVDGHLHPSLALAAASRAASQGVQMMRVANVNSTQLVLDRTTVPLDGRSNVLVRYRGKKRTFRYESAATVMNGTASPAAFKDKLVLVGTTALGTREVVATPLDTLFTGVEVQATLADNLLQADFFYRPEYASALETQAVLVFGVLLTLVVVYRGPVWGSATVLAGVVLVWGGSSWLMSTDGAFLSPLYPTIGLGLSIASMTAGSFIAERRRADRAGRERAASQRLMVQTMVSLTAVHDEETGRHSRRTREYTRILAQELASHPGFTAYLTAERIELLADLAPLHDIGKVGVSDALLNKPGALTPDELIEMRKHPALGRNVIVNAEAEAGVHDDATLGIIKDIVYTHHEKWDGTGYPQGLKGTQIPIAGRLMAVVDVYDAVTTERPYQQPMTHDQAVAFITRGKGTHFDPSVVDAFLRVAPVIREFHDLPASA
jgi:CHASE2 domain-containing sensor protein